MNKIVKIFETSAFTFIFLLGCFSLHPAQAQNGSAERIVDFEFRIAYQVGWKASADAMKQAENIFKYEGVKLVQCMTLTRAVATRLGLLAMKIEFVGKAGCTPRIDLADLKNCIRLSTAFEALQATATALDTKVPLYVKPSMPAPIPSPSPIPPPAQAPTAGTARRRSAASCRSFWTRTHARCAASAR